jgi:hypothetical protein
MFYPDWAPSAASRASERRPLSAEETMPKNPKKRHCEVEGCRAWARRGESLCASHLSSRAVQERSELILPLLRAVSRRLEDLDLDDLRVIDEELRQLFMARATFMRWLDELRAQPEGESPGPSQFLRAWNDSTSRVVQLLRARRELAPDLVGGKEGEFGELIRSVYDELEKE